MKDWKLDRAGNVEMLPLAGYQTALFGPLAAVRFEYYENEQAFDARQVSAVQLHMSADQAEELAQVLLKKAEQLRKRPEGTGH